jgi:hypothetical protein
MIEYYFVKVFAVLRKLFERIWDVFIWVLNKVFARWFFFVPLLLISMYVLGYWAYWMIKVILN